MKTLISLAGALILIGAAKESIVLQFALEENKVYKQDVSIENTIKQSFGMQEMVVESSIRSSTYFELVQREANGGLYDIWYADLATESKMDGMEQNISSDDDSTPLGAVLGALVEKKFQVEIDNKGEVGTVSGLEEILSEAMEGTDAAALPMAEMIETSYGEPGLIRNLEMTLNIFTDEKLKKGKQWKTTQLSNSGFPLILETTFTLKSLEGGVLHIDVYSDISVDPDNADTNLQGMDATIFLEGERKGSLEVEAATGWILSGEYNDDIAGSIRLEDSAQFPEGLTVPLEIASRIHIKGQ